MEQKVIMLPEGQLYYLMCNFMWSVLSAFHYLFDDAMTPELLRLSSAWSRDRDELANWLQSEMDFVVENEKILNIRLQEISEIGEGEGDRLIFNSADRIRQATKKTYQNLGSDVTMYYCYIAWLERVIDKFSALMGVHPVAQTQYYMRYIVSNPFAALLSHLSSTDSNKKILQADASLIGEQLAQEWEQGVMSAFHKVK